MSKKKRKKSIIKKKLRKKKKGYWEDVRHRTEALNGGTSLPPPSLRFIADGGTGSARLVLRTMDWSLQAKRTLIVIGGLPKDTPKEHIIRQLRDIIKPDIARGWRREGCPTDSLPTYPPLAASNLSSMNLGGSL